MRDGIDAAAPLGAAVLIPGPAPADAMRQELRDGLGRLGVEPGQLLMVHASLRALGLARSQGCEGGADLLIDGIDAAVAPGGTWMMVLGTDYPMEWVYEHPPEERAALLAGSPPFDHRASPVLPEVGWLAEAFRRRSGTIVSGNPSGRFGARGAGAAALMANQPWHDYYGPGSPLETLCREGGRILRLGANPDTVTALHYAEYLADLPAKRRTRWDYVVADADGRRQHVWIDCLDDAEGIADYDGPDYFAAILADYLATGRAATGEVRGARAELIDAAEIVEFGARWMGRNLRPPLSDGG